MATLRSTLLASAFVAALCACVSPASAQQRFDTPEAAVEALVAAAKANDRKTVLTILGPNAQEIVSSGDPVEDANTKKQFLDAYDAKHRVVTESGKPATLLIGTEDWPFPIPVVQKDGGWRFDAAAGREELLARRIGRNELAAIQASLAYFDAQNEYADQNKDSMGLPVYAQRIISSPAKKDSPGLPRRPRPDPVSRLLLQDPDPAGPGRARRRGGLCGARQHDRRLCAARLSGRVRQLRHRVVRHQQQRRGVREGPRLQHGEDRRLDERVQPGSDVEEGGNGRDSGAAVSGAKKRDRVCGHFPSGANALA
jgi:hypothetical protein